MPENATIDITLRVQMDRARRDARQAQSMLAQIGKQAAQAGKTGASGVDRLERAIQDLHYSTVAGFDAMGDANRQFDDGLKKTGDTTDKLLSSYVDYKALAMDISAGAGQIGAMGEEAAMRRDLAESFDQLADRAGLSGDTIVAAMQKASKGTVDANTIMATSNMVLGAKFDTSAKDMAKMMEFARLKSKQYGVTVASAFQRMTLGAVKAEVEFLDEYGITIKLNDALEMYAKKLGKSKNALKANERSQALWNALLIQADEQLVEFPGGVDKATDSYERMRLKVLNATQAMGDFIDRSKIGPIMSITAQAIQGVAAVMTPMILMKQMATQASMAHTVALTKETAALAAQGQAAGGAAAAGGGRTVAGALRAAPAGLLGKAGLGAGAMGVAGAAGLGIAAGSGIAVYKKHQEFQKTLSAGNEQAADSWDKHERSLRSMMDAGKSASEIAREHAQARNKVSAALHKDGNALQDFTAAVIRNNVNEEELINKKQTEVAQIILLSSRTYPEYAKAMGTLNDELPKGAERTDALTEANWRLEDRLRSAGEVVDDNVKKFKAMASAYQEAAEASSGLARLTAAASAKMYEGLGEVAAKHAATVAEEELKAKLAESAIDQADAARIAADAIKTYSADADTARRTQEALSVAMGQTTYQEIENRKELQLLAQGLAMGTVSQERYLAAIEDVKDGTLELSAAEREAIATANLRAQATEMQADHMAELAEITSKYQDQGTQATEQYEKSREDRARQHAQRKEDIERQHRLRLQEIERNYSKSVAEAAIARDAIGILSARETRAEELADAERARSEGQAGEDRSFNETNRSATESYQARVAEIDRMRQEELARVRTMQAQETEALRQQQADMVAQIAEAQALQTQLEIEEKRKQQDAGRNAANAARQEAYNTFQAKANLETAMTTTVYENDAARLSSAQRTAAQFVQTWQNAYAQVANAFGGRSTGAAAQAGRGRRGARGRNYGDQQHGGEGWVKGPASFSVASGAREYVSFSGDQRQMSPSRASVSGGVDLNVSSKLGEQAGPLADMLAEKLLPQIDEFLAGSVMEAFA